MLEAENKSLSAEKLSGCNRYSSGYGRLFNDEINNFLYDIKLNYRLIRKKIRKYINKKLDKTFTNIVYLTAECPYYMPKVERLDSPVDYVYEMRKQFPDINICILVPLIGLNEDTKISKKITVDFDDNFLDLERTSINCEFFAQNKIHEFTLYKFCKNDMNITVYGIFSPDFSYVKNAGEIKSFEKSLLFLKAARCAIQNLYKENFKPDIVHSEFLPFFLGAEFEPKFPVNIKVLQIFDNFAKMEEHKQELFWSVINMADKKAMKIIQQDSAIRNYIARLFNLPVNEVCKKTDYYIDVILENYNLFTQNKANGESNKENTIFKNLDTRIKKLFPNTLKKAEKCYYPFLNTISACDYWVVNSYTYYKNLYENALASGAVIKELIKTADKSGFAEPAFDIKNISHQNNRIYNAFNIENYRDERIKNKKILIKEFSMDTLKTNFIDNTIFKDFENTNIYGYLDTFYDAPLLFANPEADIFNEGADILFNTILKLFERNRNIQVILCIKDGLKNDYIRSLIKFISENNIFMGRWVYIDGEVNLPKILSAADIFMYPARFCNKSLKHLLGLHYGCIPVVSNSGILNDTVIDIFDNIAEGNGFKTKQSLLYEDENTNIYINYLEKALDLYNNNPSSWNIIIKNGFSINDYDNFSKYEQYNQIYQDIL